MSERIVFVGPGRAGLSLGYALWQAEEVEELTYFGRGPEPPSHPLFVQGHARYHYGLGRPEEGTTLLILSVPDDALPEAAHLMAAQGRAPEGAAALHLSGAHTADVLAPLHAQGYSVGTLHPLQTLAHPVTGADLLPGSTFALSGEPAARAAGLRVVSALGSPFIEVPPQMRPIYHAAAVMASSHLVSVLNRAAWILSRIGIDHDEALSALLPLARGAVENVDRLGLNPAWTGPVPRGDEETVRLHLKVLEGADRELYRALSAEVADRLADAGMDPERLDPVRALLRPKTRQD